MKARARRGSPAAREQDPTPFSVVLGDLVRSCTGALGAALVDTQGETVDYAGDLDPFDVKVAAAHLRILLHEASASRAFGGTAREIVARLEHRTFFVRALPDAYALVLVLVRGAFVPSRRAIEGASRALSLEAGWPVDSKREGAWYPVEVETAPLDRRRPARLRTSGAWQPIEVMGSLMGLRRRERGFRIRLRSGAEMTLVREPLGRWYADEPIEDR